MMLAWIYALNLIINSTLSFFTAALLIEGFIHLFRIKHPRIIALSRMLPFLKICVDLSLYSFSTWALMQGVNPLLAEKGTRELSVMLKPLAGIQFSMQDGCTFTLADLLALSLNSVWIHLIVSLFFVGSVLATGRLLLMLYYEKKLKSHPLILKTIHPLLRAQLKKKRISLATSTEISSPCIISKTILFPTSMIDNFSNEEIDAIIAHEMGHFTWRDGTFRLTWSIIAAIFWWIPTKGWQKRIEEMQEQASDAMILKYGISPTALTSAILKTIQNRPRIKSTLAVPFAQSKQSLKKRLKSIFDPSKKTHVSFRVLQYTLLLCSILSIFFGKLWIF